MDEVTKLEHRLEEIDNLLSELMEEQVDISNKLKKIRSASTLARFNTWRILPGTCLLLFSKRDLGYHWTICKAVKIEDVSKVNGEPQLLDMIVTTYGEADYDHYVRTESIQPTLDILEEFEKEYNVYIVDEVQRALLVQYMNDLKITYENFQEYESTFAKHADIIIKTPQ